MTPTPKSPAPSTPPSSPAIVRVYPGDVDHVTAVITMAFRTLEVAAWLVPNPEDRNRVLHAHFRILVDHALHHGTVHTTDDRRAAAVWFPRDRPLPPIPGYDPALEAACGRHTPRFRQLDAAFERYHPHSAHHHLALLAVYPDRQRHGVGGALLHRHHAHLDRHNLPAYLEASSLDSRRLYQRHGYTDHGVPISLPDHGPRLWPMWRTPRHPTHTMTAPEFIEGNSVTDTNTATAPAGRSADANRRILGPERDRWANDLLNRYGRGQSIREIAEATGRSYGFVHRVLIEAGAELRPRGGARRQRAR